MAIGKKGHDHKHMGLREYLSRFRSSREEDRDIVDDAPLPVMVIGTVTADDTVVALTNPAGAITEVSAAAIAANCQYTY
ncbi:unnamed protein product, partial [marine sediment metagenome]